MNEKTKDFDPVNKPEHYANGSVECIDIMQERFGKEAVMSFCVCNAFKYLWRTKYKNGRQDIEKARWYIDKYLDILGDEESK